MNTDIKFSIIVPVYNVEKYIEECVQSVLRQSYIHFELILVDDGSSDNSGMICDRYAKEYSFVKSFHKENGGQLQTREYGVAHSEGDFLVFLDSDDYLEPNALQVIYNTIIAYDSDCVIYGMQRVINGKVIDVVADNIEKPNVVTEKRVLFKTIFGSSGYNSMCRKALSATLVKEVDYSTFYHIRYGEDLLQSIEMLDRAEKVVFIPDVLYNYRVNPASVTQTLRYEKYSPDFQVRQYVRAYIEKNGLFTDEDFYEYRAYAIRLLINEIETIAGFRTSLQNKKKIFYTLHLDEYYTEFLDSDMYDKRAVGMKHILFPLFRKKHFTLIVAIVYCFDLLRKLRDR